MSEQFLDHAEVRSPIQEVRGEGVAERVGVGGNRRPAVEDAADITRSEPVSPTVVEECTPR